MKKSFLTILILTLCAFFSSAQNDTREPGLYAIVGKESLPLTAIRGISSNTSTGILGIEVSREKKKFKGVTSDKLVPRDANFVMVCDMNKKVMSIGLKEYNVFVKTMTPDNMMIIPLTVNKKNREYDDGVAVSGINTKKKVREEFSWEMISDNSFLIHADLEPGEYMIVFRPAKLGQYDFNAGFDFTVVDGIADQSETSAQDETAPQELIPAQPATDPQELMPAQDATDPQE